MQQLKKIKSKPNPSLILILYFKKYGGIIWLLSDLYSIIQFILKSKQKRPLSQVKMNYLIRKSILAIVWMLTAVAVEAKLPQLEDRDVTRKLDEIMLSHVSFKEYNSVIAERELKNYLEELDPIKTYLLATEIKEWTNPSPELLKAMVENFKKSDFSLFVTIHDKMITAIERRNLLEKKIAGMELPKNVEPKEFKDLKWCENEEELMTRLLRLKALRYEAIEKLGQDVKELSEQRLEKRRQKFEEDFLVSDPKEKHKFILSNVLKASASSLDTHTAYFTPGEANQFMINVQQRLFGIGAQLRDDIKGFTVVKIIEGGPSAKGGQLKVKDRIIAVNKEPVVGMDIEDAVELIRGEEGTPVTLSVIRTVQNGEEKKEEQLEIDITRGEVVLNESRLESSVEPYGDGVIAYLKLFSFYQDPDSSSATDMKKAFEKIKKDNKVKGVVLDLRYNAGGLLSQAVSVTGLFITKGVVVSIKDNAGAIQHLRDTDGTVIWDGPLIVLANRASASASEIVTQTLQDYGRAIIVGDEATFGKGSFQTFTLNTARKGTVNPEGEYKVTRGRYYTVSGRSPQLTGVKSDIVVPGALSKVDIGERFAKYPLDTDTIPPSFDDELDDVPANQRQSIAQLYKFNLQKPLKEYVSQIDLLKKNSDQRMKQNKNYQIFLQELDNKDKEAEGEDLESFGQNDLQLGETYNIMKDFIYLMEKTSEKTPTAA